MWFAIMINPYSLKKEISNQLTGIMYHQCSYVSGTLLLILSLFIFISCSSEKPGVDIESEEYEQAIADFYMSLAASQTDQARFAFNKMNAVAQAYPQETAAWTNLGVYAMRQGNFDLAQDRFSRAREQETSNSDVLFLSSIMESRRGNIGQSIEYLRQAVALEPSGLKIRFALAKELEREDDAANSEEIKEQLNALRDLIPGNQVVLFELTRLAVKDQDKPAAEEYLTVLESQSENWSDRNREQLTIVKNLLNEENYSDLSLELSFLRSGLESEPHFQSDLREVELPPTDLGFLITEFLWLPVPETKVPEPDLDLQFTQSSIAGTPETVQWIKGVTLLEEVPPFPVSISEGNVIIDDATQLPFPGSETGLLGNHVFTEIDINYNFRNDIALAGNEGFRLYMQNVDESFSDITNEIGLPQNIISDNYRGIWAMDVDMDGDLDLLAAPVSSSPVVLRNNGDLTFTVVESFPGLNPVTQFEWADMNGDGVPEAIFLTTDGELVLASNQRGGRFDGGTRLADQIAAVTVADINSNGQFDMVTAEENGTLARFYLDESSGEWESELLFENEVLQTNSASLFSADLDNNGAVDLLLSTNERSQIWLGAGGGDFSKLESELPGGITSVFDVDGDVRLDLLGVSEELEPIQWSNSGSKPYFSRSVRARASGTAGDQRINSFGIGGEMEVRSGLLYQKQLISSPIVHFGLGEYEEAQMLRIIWPNGSVQAEFAELGMGSTIFNEQILKGSCPWLFTGDGEEVHFITDILWRSPLGLRINAQETAGVAQTLDRVRIPADKLKPEDGFYDVRITAELWESHFFDYVSLVAVDHPENSEIFVDERFVIPVPDLSTKIMGKTTPVQRVTDQQGHNVTETVSKLDQTYISPFEKTAYQGLVKEHSIEIELNHSQDGTPQWLILSGWLRPTDSSINLALSQGSVDSPKGLKVEVPGRDGKWKVLHDNYGFPAGKLKSILLDLEDVFENQDDQRVRLTTTTEIYWDVILQADKMDPDLITETKLEPEAMDLRYRGFSEWNRADSTSPSLPEYSEISSTTQRWRDLEGFHTRFGNVAELLSEIDDRYVIMNAGDELLLKFSAMDEPKEGYQRSFVFVSDGWEKDGDYNTEASSTVLPLPYHGQNDYKYSQSGTLFEDPVFQQHRDDWIQYHTRYITPYTFRTALIYKED